MALSEKQMLLLDCFMYSDLAPKNCGKTMEDIIKQYTDPSTGKVSVTLLEKSGVNLSGDLPGHYDYLADIMNEINEDPKLRSLSITHTTEEYKGSIRAACFVDTDGDATVAFRGTGGSYRQWNNNFEGYGDSSQQSQEAAATFINSLPFKSVDVTGHSNGGDQAMYVAIVCGDKVRRCVSYEGQGVSKEFVIEHSDEIAQNKNKIKNICASKDFVSPLLISVAGETLYIESDSSLLGGLFSHGSYGLWTANKDKFDADGNFKEDAFVEQVWYCEAIHNMTVLLSSMSDIPIVGSCLELVSDIVGVIVGGIISKDWSEALSDVAKSLKEFAVGLANDAKTIIKKGLDALKHVYDGIVSWFNRSSTQKYVENNPLVELDTYKLAGYARRLSSVNSRVVKLDKRLDSLYWSIGLKDIWNLLQADALIGYSWRISRCAEYLLDTSDIFERIESELQNAL